MLSVLLLSAMLGASPPAQKARAPGPDTAADLQGIRRAEQLLLQNRFDDLSLRLDSLWRDSLPIVLKAGQDYRRLLAEARMVRDQGKAEVAALLAGVAGADDDAWMSLRARAQMSVDSLQRAFDRACAVRRQSPPGG